MRLFVSDNTTGFISDGWKKPMVSVAKHYLSRIGVILFLVACTQGNAVIYEAIRHSKNR